MSKVLAYIQAHLLKSCIAAALIVLLIVVTLQSNSGKSAAAERLERQHAAEIELQDKVIRSQKALNDHYEERLKEHRDK